MSLPNLGFGWLQVSITIATFIATSANSSLAQITPDETLPNNSNVRVEDNTRIIEGGTEAGDNLFHSFSEFSVPTGSEAWFNNSTDIQNIFSRVTGGSISNIDGLMRANGTANLFLLNPNGIIFGENARLDIEGSFVGTTADSLKFADGREFSAVNPQSPPLLSVEVPMGLQYGPNPGEIQVMGDGQGRRGFDSPIIDLTQNALRVQPNQTLALVGGELNLEGATLKTAGGRIELGSVAGNGLVGLTPDPDSKGFTFDYSGVENLGDVQLSRAANVDASGEGAGDVKVQGRSVSLTEGSVIEASTLGEKSGGNLVVNGTESVEINQSFMYALVYPGATGDGGAFDIETSQLLVQDGSQISAGTFGSGQGGNLTVTADETIEVIGRSADGLFGSGLFTRSSGEGDGGELTITTSQLLVQDGAQISAGTFGAGNAGNLTVTANESIQVIGRSADARVASGLFADSSGQGEGGELTIATGQLLVQDGAQIGAGTFGAGNAGNLTVTANESIQVIGTTADGEAASGLFASSSGEGDGGELTIATGQLLLENGGIITAQSFGSGISGNIEIDVKENFNADNGQIITTAEESRGGNITITAGQNIILRNDSDIRTTLSTTTGSGGDIKLTANAIVALEDSDILAFAPFGRDGNITFNTNAFLSDSLFTSTAQTNDPLTESELNQLDGNNRVDVNATGSISGILDTSQLQDSLTQLTTNSIDTEALVASSCVVPSRERKGTFYIVGPAGLPYRPGEAVPSVYSAVGIQPIPQETPRTPRWKKGDPIIEPTGVYLLENGQRILSRECGT